ncbi:Protein CHUP1, chloroplastic [Ananas comosus]|uniref:Protein CHUP1, chloroplastic n=1 Tax=Ananas comosus TaxID=4615 RepID=A0A199VP68_ANACO|nr:Protein CHUP1, chloroplastic [Ananas comosus]
MEAKTCMRYFFSMEREKRVEDIKTLLKVIIPLAFPIAGFIISTLMTSRTSERDPSISPSREEREMDSHLYVSQHEFDDEHCTDEPFGNDEAEDKELEAANSSRSPTTQEITVMERYENPDEISIEQEEKGLNLNEEIASLKSIITVLEERVHEFQNRFHDYYYMKEEESTFQKLQIMCLGLKLEFLESQNQRLERTVAEFQEAIEGFDVIRADYAMLQQKFKRLSKINTRNSRIIRQEVSNLNAREIELSKEKAELELVMREIKELGNQFQEERKAMQENLKMTELMNKYTSKDKEVEVPIEECNIRQLSGKEETLDQLGQIRGRWAGDMEEMIYIGWITACLRRELTMNQQEEITRISEEALALPEEKGDLLTVYTAATAEVQSCCVDFDQATCTGSTEDDGETGIDVAVRNENRGSGKRRLLHKLKGWAKLKGKSKSKGSCYRDDKSYQKSYDSS